MIHLSENLRAVALVAAFAAVGAARAQVVNGSFETSAAQNKTSIASWNTSGDVFLSDSSIFTAPSAGSYDATLATQTDGQSIANGGFGEHGGVGTTSAVAENFLGLATGALQNVGNGKVANVSALSQTIHLNVGDTLLFSYDFLTNQVYNDHTTADAGDAVRPSSARDDFSFLSLSAGSFASVIKLQDVFDGYVNLTSAQDGFLTAFAPTAATNPFVSETGYLSYAYVATATGDYKVGFGVANAYTGNDPFINSGLLVDNVRVQSVPEPATFAALGLGLLGIVRRRRSA